MRELISWQHLDPDRFEKAVRALLSRIDPDVVSVDGAGGDEGRDAQKQDEAGLHVFEMKFFPGRLTSSQKRQIKRSLTTAAANASDLASWTLIVPLERSPAERQWFERLQTEFPDVELHWWGLDWLNQKFAAHGDLARYVEGSAAMVIRAARETAEEQAVLARGAQDLATRNANLRQRVEEASTPQWTYDWAVDSEGTSLSLRERYPGAAHDDPIAVTADVAFDRDDPDSARLEARYKRAVGWGGSVTISEPHLRGVTIQASQGVLDMLGVDAHSSGGTLEFASRRLPIDPPIPARLSARSDADGVERSVDVVMDGRMYGRQGVSVTGHDLTRLLSVTIRADYPDGSGTIDAALDITVAPLVARDVETCVNVLAVLDAARSSGTLTVTSAGLGRVDIDRASELELPVVQTLPLLRALHRLGQHAGTPLSVPAEVTAREEWEFRWFAAALDTDQVETDYKTWTATLWPDRVEKFLGDVGDQDRQLRAHHDNVRFDVGGKQFDYGPAIYYGPRMRLMNIDEIRRWRPGGGDDGPRATFQTVGEPIYLVGGETARSLLTGT